MDRYGLIGKSLKHSFSASYFNNMFMENGILALYELWEIEEVQKIKEIVKIPYLRGLNVTIPFKEQIIPFLDTIQEDARNIGAVNCIKVDRGVLSGYNTDAIGFEKSMKKYLPQIKRALVLGSGGASKAIVFILNKWNIKFDIVSRNPSSDYEIGYDQVSPKLMASIELIINTTPLGMHPDVTSLPSIPYESLNNKHILFDAVYNPQQSLFLSKGAAISIPAINGYDMLRYQADASWTIWQGHLLF